MTGSMTNGSWSTPSSDVWRRRVLVAAAICGVLIVSLSARIAVWWGNLEQGRSWAPAPLSWVLVHRPDLGEADVHVVMWFLVASLGAWAVRTARQRPVVLAAVWVAGAVVEAAQAAFTTRSAQWTDLAGNTVGILAAAALVLVASLRAHDRAVGSHTA